MNLSKNIGKRNTLVLLILIATLSLILLTWLFLLRLDRQDSDRLKANKRAANAVGITRAKQECTKAGINPKACSQISAVTSEADCNGMTCWSVYAQVNEPEYFGASVTVKQENNQFVATDYLRNTATE